MGSAAMEDPSREWSVSHCVSVASSIEALYAESGVRHQHHLEFYECVALCAILDGCKAQRCDMRRDM